MHIQIGYHIELKVNAPTMLLGALNVHPSRQHDLLAPEVLRTEPALPIEQYRDPFDNVITRINVPAGTPSIRISNSAVVRDSGELDTVNLQARQLELNELPAETLQFLLPSRYCEVDSELLGFAWNQFGSSPPGWERVRAICTYVHQHIRFDYQQARANRSALEGWRERVGVCRDFSHLAITFCRAMNIPARYTTGYMGDIGIPSTGTMDFSAWFQVYLGDRWYTFDARHNRTRIGRIVMAMGRDAADVPITMVFGQNTLSRFAVTSDELPEVQI
ncbi:transglutaminase-like domain-containing protein [Ottowia thiooxydans]|uniref:transglutaminase-like domain-containing protein n=1 Tax=Ottowia thiooxydans TaxID=219182 RepID=UPI0004222D55|nr:transglutaminase family protein [Ottowia thiooxydans]